LTQVNRFNPVAYASGFARQDMPGREKSIAKSSKYLILLAVILTHEWIEVC
jgi:hypothetical protein